MKILELPLKKEWFDMIASGEKPEEYREDKPYWRRRLLKCYGEIDFIGWCDDTFPCNTCSIFRYRNFKDYTHVLLHRGYTHKTRLYEIKEMDYGLGRPEWGAPDKAVFIIRLGKEVKL